MVLIMKSTRLGIISSPSEAIIKGLAKDGGLYIFESLDSNFYNDGFIGLSYQETALKVFEELLYDFSSAGLAEMIDSTYNQTLFKDSIVELNEFDNYAYLSLYKGETFSFKDIALSILPKLMMCSKRMNNDSSKTVILTATSGDTGSSSLSGFSKLGVDVIVLYPTDGVSSFQERQMLQFQDSKNRVIAIEGNFDDAQKLVKEILINTTFGLNITSANSINIGRIVPQIVYYFYAYSELVKNGTIKSNDLLNVVIPTGNFGNLYACYIAKKMGLPIGKLVVASNENDNLNVFFKTGTYDIRNDLSKTISPSMDIIISSNIERYLYSLVGETRTTELMDQLKRDHLINVPEILAQEDIISDFATEAETLLAIHQSVETHLIDPHTAVAKVVFDKVMSKLSGYTLIVSTASPLKFKETMRRALKSEFTDYRLLMGNDYDERVELLDKEHNKTVLSKEEAKVFIQDILKEIDYEN